MALLPLLQLAAAVDRSAAEGVAVVQVSMARGHMTPLHAHAGDEALAVLTGTLTIHVDGETVLLSAGESYVVRSGAAHAVEAGSAPVRYLTAIAARSLGRYEEFVRAVGPPGDLGSSAPALHAIAGANGTVVLGAPGALPRGVSAPAA